MSARQAGYAGFEQSELDVQYSPSSLVPDLPEILREYAERSARARAELPVLTDLRYGPEPWMTLDFFPAREPDAPLLVYVHGGYWQEMNKSDFSFPALDLVPAGAAYAALGYGLAPEYHLDRIVASVRLGLRWLVTHAVGFGVNPARIQLAGTSAGAHLVCMALLDDSPACGRRPADMYSGAILASGVYDLEPIRHTYINQALDLDAAAAARNSPIRGLPPRMPPLLVVRGGVETEEFGRQQAEFVRTAADQGAVVDEIVVADRNHFDLTFELTSAKHPLGRTVLRRLRSGPVVGPGAP